MINFFFSILRSADIIDFLVWHVSFDTNIEKKKASNSWQFTHEGPSIFLASQVILSAEKNKFTPTLYLVSLKHQAFPNIKKQNMYYKINLALE